MNEIGKTSSLLKYVESYEKSLKKINTIVNNDILEYLLNSSNINIILDSTIENVYDCIFKVINNINTFNDIYHKTIQFCSSKIDKRNIKNGVNENMNFKLSFPKDNSFELESKKTKIIFVDYDYIKNEENSVLLKYFSNLVDNKEYQFFFYTIERVNTDSFSKFIKEESFTIIHNIYKEDTFDIEYEKEFYEHNLEKLNIFSLEEYLKFLEYATYKYFAIHNNTFKKICV